MKQLVKLFAILLIFTSILSLTGCGTTSGSVNYSVGVYGGYGYPYGRYGGCCNNDINIDIDRPGRPDRPNKPVHPILPDRPDRPTVKPARPPTSMGRPSRPQMSSPMRMPRGGRGSRR